MTGKSAYCTKIDNRLPVQTADQESWVTGAELLGIQVIYIIASADNFSFQSYHEL